MRAFISKCDEDGKQIRLGTLGNYVSAEYKTLKNLLHFGFKGMLPGRYRVEIHNDWATRYAEPDSVVFKTVE